MFRHVLIPGLLLEALALVGQAGVQLQAPPPPQAPPVPAACVCGDSCKCKAGTCPGKCPVATAAPAGYPPAPAGFRWETYPSGVWGLVQDGVRVPAAPIHPNQPFGSIAPRPTGVWVNTPPQVCVGPV